MKKASVLIIAKASDITADAVEHLLRAKGHNVARINGQELSEANTLVTLPSSGNPTLEQRGIQYPLNAFTSVWYRNIGPIESRLKDTKQRPFAERELEELLVTIYTGTQQAFWVSNREALVRASNKYRQLPIAERAGFRIPRTCITNNPQSVRTFLSEVGQGTILYKTLRTPYIADRYEKEKEGEAVMFVPASLVTAKDEPYIDSIVHTGGIFQEYIQKDYELRVTVMGNRVFAAKIDSQKNPDQKGKIDWRVGEMTKEQYLSYTLPSDVAEKCLRVVRECGLQFGAIDLIKTPEGDYVFLEINPNGQWLWIANSTQEPYVETMADLLTDPEGHRV